MQIAIHRIYVMSQLSQLAKLFIHVAGMPPSTVEKCSDKDKMVLTGLGLLFILNWVVLVAVWIKTATHYFGSLAGVFVGILIPSLVLCVDRIIAMRPRELTGELESYSIKGRVIEKPIHLKLRILIAIVFSLFTGFTFMMVQADPLLQNKAVEFAKLKNEPIRAEHLATLENQHSELIAKSETKRSELLTQQSNLNTDIDSEKLALTSIEKDALAARDEQSKECGGVDGRLVTCGPKAYAFGEIAARLEDRSQSKKAEIKQQQEALQVVTDSLATLDANVHTSTSFKNAQVANIDSAIASDTRFQHVARDMFSDATLFFILMWTWPDGIGLMFYSIVTILVLIAIEAAFLIGLAFVPNNTAELASMLEMRQKAAELVVNAEMMKASTETADIEILPTNEFHEDGSTKHHTPPNEHNKNEV